MRLICRHRTSSRTCGTRRAERGATHEGCREQQTDGGQLKPAAARDEAEKAAFQGNEPNYAKLSARSQNFDLWPLAAKPNKGQNQEFFLFVFCFLL